MKITLLSQGFLFLQPAGGQAAGSTAGSVPAAGMVLGATASLVPPVLLSVRSSRTGRADQPELLQRLSGPRRVKRAPPQGPKSQEEIPRGGRAELRYCPWQSGAVDGKMVQSPGASQLCGFCNKHTANKFIIEQITSLWFKPVPFPLQALSGRWQRSTNQPRRLEAFSPLKSKRRQAGRAVAGCNEVSIISAVATRRL